MRSKKRTAISRRRLWLFRIAAMVLAPILFLSCIEVGLRLLGHGYSPSAILVSKGQCRDNVRFAWRFFPPYLARVGEPFLFPKDKDEGTYRVFVLGASAAAGIPDPAYGFGRILKVMLRQAYPGTNFEIINTAITATNSHVVVEMARDCARYDPDLFIVYLGNNEVVGPYGPSSVFTERAASLPLIQVSKWCKATRFGQLLTAAAGKLAQRKDLPIQWEGMAMFLDRQVRADDPALRRVYRQFRANLEGIQSAALKSGAKVAFCTVGCNLRDCPPFASQHRADLKTEELQRWQRSYEQGMACEQAEQWAEAAAHFEAARQIDGSFAELHFRLAKCHWALGEFKEAKSGFIKARDLDTLRFRPDAQINEMLRQVASGREQHGVYLVDAAGAFASNSPQGCPGAEHFLEHVHLTFAGNYLLAKTIFEKLKEALPADVVGNGPAGTATLPSEADCARSLAYTAWDHYSVTADLLASFLRQPPFTGQAYHDTWVRQVERVLAQQQAALTPQVIEDARQQYEDAIGRMPNDWQLRFNYGRFLSAALGDARGAVSQFQTVAEHVPHHFRAHVGLGAELLTLGLYEQSIAHNLQAIAIMPTRAAAHNNLAAAYLQLGRLDQAEEHLLQTLRWRPDDLSAYDVLADVYVRQERTEEAVSLCRRALQFAPNSAAMHCKLGIILGIQGNRDEAMEQIRQAARLDPNSPEVRKVLDALRLK
ncbi:MAG: tetratricopeptide repeat protein [Sedimentisphaerales bacterium]|nr:tetratricopeptide repeat protein [Sedimentisphaerales bacterium]